MTGDARPPIEVGTTAGDKIVVPHETVFVGNVSAGQVSNKFAKSLADMMNFDLVNGLGLWEGTLWAESGANISKARNEIITRFLDTTDGVWLLMLDSDMVFPPSTILRLLASAHVTRARMVGGLCVFVGPLGPVPTLYQRRADAITAVQLDYPDDAQLQVAATGAACLMAHRDVLAAHRDDRRAARDWLVERFAEETAAGDGGLLGDLAARDLIREPSVTWPWFVERVRLTGGITVDGVDIAEHWMGEDIDFCLRLGERTPIFVDCSLEIGHDKVGRVWYPADIRTNVGAPRPPIVAVIPVKDRLDLTSDLVHQLRVQGDVDEIVVCDNGSGATTRNWLESQPDIVVLDMPDVGIHRMWNAAIDRTLERHGPRARIAFLNNDLRLGAAFLRTLSQALTDHRDMDAVCGNYDGRRADVDVVPTVDIAAGRTDGTGGFAGFAFMVRGEWFSSGWRFPEQCTWWFGDNDLVESIAWADTHRGFDDRAHRCGIVVAAHVDHLGGGTAGDVAWTRFADQTAADQAAYEQKWAAIRAADIDTTRVRDGDLEPLYEHLLGQPSDIVEHLPTLHDLAVKLGAGTVIELGVRTGVSSVAWLAALQRTGGHLWAVDTSPAPPTVTRHAQCTFVQGDDLSDDVLGRLPDQADIVFVDTDHRHSQTTAEIAAYAPRVRPGGCLVFHDTAVERFPHHPPGEPPWPVRAAIEEWLAANPEATVDWWDNCNGLAVVHMPETEAAP